MARVFDRREYFRRYEEFQRAVRRLDSITEPFDASGMDLETEPEGIAVANERVEELNATIDRVERAFQEYADFVRRNSRYGGTT